MTDPLSPGQINLVVRDLGRTIEFYRLLGVPVADPVGQHAVAAFGNGLRIEFDEFEFARVWNAGTPEVGGGSAVLTMNVATRGDVDSVSERMTVAGYRVRQIPYDTFWGSRFAVLEDPDGYQIGLMSPSDNEQRYWPPRPAPAA